METRTVEQCTGVIHTKSAVILQNARALLVNVVAQLTLYPKTVFLQYVNSGFPSGGPFITFLIKSEIATSVISNKYIGCVMRYSF